MNIFTKVPGLVKQTSKLGSVLQRAFYGSSGRVTLFEQRNFAGRRLDLTSDCQKLSEKNFPDRCNSVQVESGAWAAYEHENFRGRQYLWDMFDKGEYNCTDRWCAQGDHISSVRAVKQAVFSNGDTSSVTEKLRKIWNCHCFVPNALVSLKSKAVFRKSLVSKGVENFLRRQRMPSIPLMTIVHNQRRRISQPF
ncbi:crystallin beta gamma X [Garra rufa]|uniref:crystallin beta gamma X n=1 Tax=Garra rufa TaxID=137080 RepID=UPI003CCE8616